jgi:hypothetical protein
VNQYANLLTYFHVEGIRNFRSDGSRGDTADVQALAVSQKADALHDTATGRLRRRNNTDRLGTDHHADGSYGAAIDEREDAAWKRQAPSRGDALHDVRRADEFGNEPAMLA